MSVWNYYHQHLQDNVNASAVWAILGYFYGRHHFKKLQHHIKRIHEHLGINDE